MLLVCFFLLLQLFLPIQIFAHSPTTTVTISSSGFAPQNITVDQSATVTFLNKDSADHWPASDFHPTHDLYPEFDPQKPIKSGEFWIFKPQKVGTWRYHDHLFPHQKGTLIVTPESDTFKPASSPSSKSPGFITQLHNFLSNLLDRLKSLLHRSAPNTNSLDPQSFKNSSAKDQYQALTDLANQKGAPAVWQFIQSSFKGESGMTGNVHDLAHLTGKLLYDHNGFSGLDSCTPNFAFGCYHGFFDAAFAQSLDQLPQAETACSKLSPTLSGPVASCLHGIGHGVASFHQTDNLTQSLTDCDRLTGDQQYCYDGVFMEFARAAPKNFYQAKDPLYPCTNLDSKYVFSCGRNQPTVMIQHLGLSFNQVVNTCLKSPSIDLQQACFDSLGFMAASNSQGQAQSIVSICNQIPDSIYRARCATAAAGELIFQEVPNWHISSPQICDSLTNPYRITCWDHLNQLVKDYNRPPLLQPRSLNQSPSDYLVSLMQQCLDAGSTDRCYQQAAHLLSTEFSLKDSLAFLKDNENSPPVYARCHELTHYLSRIEYQKTSSIPEVYASCDSTCHGGCYHGVLEQYLKDKNLALDSSSLAQEFSSMCNQVRSSEKPLVYYECFHGLGHAAMFITDMEVPLSLKLCDALGDPSNQERCYGGVFMENSSSSTNNSHPGKYIKADDPFYPCNSLEEKYLRLCYRYQSSYFSLITHQDWSKTADLCLQVPTSYQPDCFRTIGTNQVGFTQDLSQMSLNCQSMPQPEFQAICINGVIASFSYRFVGDLTKMTQFCSHVSSSYQQGCFKQIGTSIKDWVSTQSQARKLCSQIPQPQYASWCQEVI